MSLGFSRKHCEGYGYVRQSETAPAKTAPVLKNLKKIHDFCGFSRCVKAKRMIDRIVCRGDFPENIARDAAMFSNRGQPPQKPFRF
jgi:hypothetical protein